MTITAEDLKMYQILIWHNKQADKDEYVQVKTICPTYCLVAHLGEWGSWIVYYKDEALSFPNDNRDTVLKRFRENALIATLLKCKLAGAGIDEEIRKHVGYEANFVNPDFEPYKKLLEK